MVDGSIIKFKLISFYLQWHSPSFSEKDILRLIEILRIKFELSCGIIVYDKLKKTYRILINKSAIA